MAIVVFTLAAAVLVAYLLGWRPHFLRDIDRTEGDSARDILRQRYMDGEITREEFEALQRDLTE